MNSGGGDIGGSTSAVAASWVGLRCDVGGSVSAMAGSWVALFLILTTSMWEFECKEGTNVGLAAGRYSGKRRPDLYRTPHALQSVFGPIGPSLHCGVSVTSQCEHFFVTTGCGEEFRIISVVPDVLQRVFVPIGPPLD